MATHELTLTDVVVKRFRSYDQGEHRREWRGLHLLDRYAPGLAPGLVDFEDAGRSGRTCSAYGCSRGGTTAECRR
jgi:hypothetical protein